MRGIKRSERFEEIAQQLGNTHHPLTKKSLFSTLRDVMCFAAVLGFQNQMRKPLSESTNEIDPRIWENSSQAEDLVYLIALAAEKDGEILLQENEDKMVQIFEEYAQGGFETIELWLKETPADHNGDEAILAAFQKNGFLEPTADPEVGIGTISF